MEDITCYLYKSFPLQREVKRQKVARTLIGKELEEQSPTMQLSSSSLWSQREGACHLMACLQGILLNDLQNSHLKEYIVPTKSAHS